VSMSIHLLASDDHKERTEGIVALMHKVKNIEHSVAGLAEIFKVVREDYATDAEVKEAMSSIVLARAEIRNDIKNLQADVKALQLSVGTTSTINVLVDRLTNEVEHLKASLLAGKSQVQGGWFVVTLIASVVMGAFSLVKQFLYVP
jgi:hypothetical protein